MTHRVITHVLSLAMVLSVLSMRLSQAADQPPSGPPDMLALYLTRIDAQSIRFTLTVSSQFLVAADRRSIRYRESHSPDVCERRGKTRHCEGGDAIFVQTNVPQAPAVEALISQAVETYGRVDCAHNNAGISGAGIAGTHRALTAAYPEERWHQVIAVNLTGVWLCMKYALHQMLHQGGGVIVNTASAAGLVGLPSASAYVASKHGVVGRTKTAALEYATQGIRVNGVCPGSIQTPMTERGLSDPERMARIIASEPIGRVGTPEEVAEGVVWLCSDAASFVTGHTMTVDGGDVAQ